MFEISALYSQVEDEMSDLSGTRLGVLPARSQVHHRPRVLIEPSEDATDISWSSPRRLQDYRDSHSHLPGLRFDRHIRLLDQLGLILPPPLDSRLDSRLGIADVPL